MTALPLAGCDVACRLATPAVFLDRDGTLIEDKGALQSPADAVFYRGTVPALQLITERFKLFIVTHQPWVSAGTLTARQVDDVNAFIVGHLASFGIGIEQVYCCPHRRTDGCVCIKPKPYLLHVAAREHGVDLAKSFVIGDHPHDVELARNVGATGIYLLTGHGNRHRTELPASTVVVYGIREAAGLILKRCTTKQGDRRPCN